MSHILASCVTLLFVISTTLWRPANAQQPDPVPVPIADPLPLTADEVTQNLAQMNLNRVQVLHAYQATRIYRAKYHGFPGDRSAEMTVNVKYLPPGKKEFVIESESGSTLIIDRVFKKLLDAEEEEQGSKFQHRSALTEDNYRFTLIALWVIEKGDAIGRHCLYRGAWSCAKTKQKRSEKGMVEQERRARFLDAHDARKVLAHTVISSMSM